MCHQCFYGTIVAPFYMGPLCFHHVSTRVINQCPRDGSRNQIASVLGYSVLHNKLELPFFAKPVCVTLFWPKIEI
jgi:hypothetical protein